MSADLFTNGTEAIQRLESLLEAKLKKYCISFMKSKVVDLKTKAVDLTGSKSISVMYSITIEGCTRNDKNFYKTIDGENFPDLFNKASDFITSA